MLYPLRKTDVALDEGTVTVEREMYDLDADTTVRLLRQWLTTHAALTEQLEGGDVQEMWIKVHPGPTRRGQPTRPAALPAALRTLHVAHQELTRQLFQEPVRLGKFRAEAPALVLPRRRRAQVRLSEFRVHGGRRSTGTRDHVAETSTPVISQRAQHSGMSATYAIGRCSTGLPARSCCLPGAGAAGVSFRSLR
jgi:hypothetical protein